jgi:hypothetical protein
MPPLVPVSEQGKLLASRVSPDRWARLVRDALERESILQDVKTKHMPGRPWRETLGEVAPEVGWSLYCCWRKRYHCDGAPGWESLLDERVPPDPVRIGDAVRKAACLLRRANPGINCDAARKALVAEFGEKGGISDSSLRRIWKAAGLSQPTGGARRRGKRYDCGGGLTLLAAAEAETGVALGLGRAIHDAAVRTAARQSDQEVPTEPVGRDKGRFTAAYNGNVRSAIKPGEMDPRRASDATKRDQRLLCKMRTLKLSPENLAAKLMAMGVTPLLSERHGFDGLEGPRGQCLEVLGGHGYMPATLDKTLAEWAVLDVADALWEAHARQWIGNVQRWCDGMAPWQQLVVYVDGTQDPYWTRQYALSGKVSGVGRVMPCVSQIAVSAGASPPLLIKTLAGQATLKTELAPVLRRLESIVGEGVGRITVIDAEMCATKTLAALMAMKPARIFITVLKGWHNRNVKFQPSGDWQPYRERDEVREGTVVLRGEGAPQDGMPLRAVEMVRTGSRHPKPTIFLTNALTEEVPDLHLTTTEVADVYLSRWPNQEGDFRNRRNGGGADRTHGYGGEYVENVAFDTALEKAERAVQRAEARVVKAKQALDMASERKHAVAEAGARDPLVNSAVHLAEGALKNAQTTHAKAAKERDAKKTTPRQIFKRDTTRQSIATVALLTMTNLVEYVLKEYFGGLGMELRSFIEHFVNLPVTVVTMRHRVLYQIHANPRDPKRTELLRGACAEINRRALTRDGRLRVYEVVDPPGQ